MLEIAADRQDLSDTYEEWVAIADDGIARMEKMGITIEKMDVDVEEDTKSLRASSSASSARPPLGYTDQRSGTGRRQAHRDSSAALIRRAR